MSTPILGEVRMFAGNFAPRDWAMCDGQLLPIAQHSALFALLGTVYGGDGRTTFAVPDMRGRVPIHAGAGPGLTPRSLGASDGVEQVALTAEQVGGHNHGWRAFGGVAERDDPVGALLASSGEGHPYSDQPPTVALRDAGDPSAGGISPAGESQPHDNVQPYLSVLFIIAVRGAFPSRP